MKPLLDALRQPEYVHVLLNPLPLYGLALSAFGLALALAARSRPAQIIALALVLLCAGSAWPVYQYGEAGYYRVKAMADADGGAWLKTHQRRAEVFIWTFYALAALAVVAIGLPLRWPRLGLPLAILTWASALVVLAIGCWIAYAGGKVRHREFRNEPPPTLTSAKGEVAPRLAWHPWPGRDSG